MKKKIKMTKHLEVKKQSPWVVRKKKEALKISSLEGKLSLNNWADICFMVPTKYFIFLLFFIVGV